MKSHIYKMEIELGNEKTLFAIPSTISVSPTQKVPVRITKEVTKIPTCNSNLWLPIFTVESTSKIEATQAIY